MELEVELEHIVDRGTHDWAKKRELAFPQLLKGEDNIRHVFGGRKFVADDNTWQVCDINDILLRSIISTNYIRSDVNQKEGYFWTGIMAKLEEIMRDKLVCIREGVTPKEYTTSRLVSG